MDIVDPLEISETKIMKSDEEILTPVLSMTVEDDGSLNGEHEEQEVEIPSSLLDTNIDTTDADDVQYEFREDGVTYRVMQMTSDSVETLTPDITEATATITTDSGHHSVQAIYNYPMNGGIFVLGAPQKVVPINTTSQKTIISRVHEENSRPATVCRRDDRRRATHNEVERRRRDKINSWIIKLSKIIPECKNESSKGNFEAQSKGGILAKACDYITELRDSNQRLMVYAKENEQLIAEVDKLSQKVEELRHENERLRQSLRQCSNES